MLAVVKDRPAPGLCFGVEHPAPRRGAGEALLRPLLGGVCGTDLHIEAWEEPYWDLEPHLPVVLGHEFVAEVVEGERFVPGERVVALSIYGCGSCALCRKGRPQLCPGARQNSLGMSRDGAMAELLALPEQRLLSVPEEVPDASAALCEPFSTAVRAALDKCHAGHRVAVLGPGTIGLMAAMLGLLKQPTRLVVAGTVDDEDRLELARTLGAATVVLSEGSEVEILLDALGGPADLVFEASGAAGAVEAGLGVLETEGELVVIGMHGQPVPMDLGLLVRGERHVEGSYAAGPGDWECALELLSKGLVDLGPLVGPTFALEEAEAAFRATERRTVGRALVRCVS